MATRAQERRDAFNRWLHKQEHKKRRCPRPGFIVDVVNIRLIARARAPWLPNVKGMRYQNGKLVPRHDH